MNTIDNTLVTMEANTRNANAIKEMILSTLFQDGKISQKTFDNYRENYQVILIKRSWFATWCEKKFGTETDEKYQYKFVQFEREIIQK